MEYGINIKTTDVKTGLTYSEGFHRIEGTLYKENQEVELIVWVYYNKAKCQEDCNYYLTKYSTILNGSDYTNYFATLTDLGDDTTIEDEFYKACQSWLMSQTNFNGYDYLNNGTAISLV